MYDDDSDFSDINPDGGFDPITAGAAYALYRHGQDAQAGQIIGALGALAPPPALPALGEDVPGVPVIDAGLYSTDERLVDWADYIGQEPLKRQMEVFLRSAKARNAPFPHTLLASGFPGVGKTTLARLIAKMMGVHIIELVPPFNIYTLVEAAEQLLDGDILFIDEIHKLADGGKKGAEILLKVLEDRVAFLPTGEVVEFNEITIIGATTDRDKLPEPVIDRFKAKPYFQPYTIMQLSLIALSFADRHNAMAEVDDDLCWVIANACRGVPRLCEELVMSARDLSYTLGRPPTGPELLAFVETEPDGLNRTHVQYLTSLRQFFPRTIRDTNEIEYVVGEAAMQQILRETKPGLARVENFLIERGLIDRTPRGRRLTDAGIDRAEDFIQDGKGASSANA